MSEYVHTAIVVTGLEALDERVTCARKQAESLQLITTEIMPGRNGFGSFMVAPSGAGSLHASADAHLTALWAFAEWLKKFGTRLDWVEVTFGREHGRATIEADCGSAESRAAVVWGKGRPS